MSLKRYWQKRDFSKTPEPKGKEKLRNSKNAYLIQKHAASHLHYDFRLELNGVLKSWAVPKGPCLDPEVKRLAVHVEDHPLEYGSFEGIIPAGQYGGGTVMMWDQGEWLIQDEDAEDAYRKGSMTFILKGKRLKGLWKLIRIKTDPKNWLLIKIEDKYAKPLSDYDITKKYQKSVVTKLTMDQIAEEGDVYLSNKKRKTNKKKVLNKGREINIPHIIHPELATLTDKPPIGDNWLHEIKLDGYGIVSFIDKEKIKLITRNQNDWTKKFPYLVEELKELPLKNAIFDGELVALNEEQQSDFQLLQNSIHNKDTSPLVYYIFDLLYYNDRDLTELPLLERKEILRDILITSYTLRYNDHIIGNGKKVFENACQLHLEGIVSKNIHGFYTQKRSRDWLKIKCIKQQEFVVGGFTKPKGSRKSFGSLLLGTYDKESGKLIYAGHVGTGFNEESLTEMGNLLEKLKSSTTPFITVVPGVKHVTWVEPKIIVEVAFSEWTKEGILRQPSFKGVRIDKKAKQVTRETPQPVSNREREASMTKPFSFLTNPDKVLYPKQGITKQDLAEYYDQIYEWMLPFVINRPLTLLRCPNGDHKKCFFQKHLDKSSMKSLHPIKIKEKSKTETYAYIKDKKGLLALVQLGVLEIHTWNCLVDKIECPDMIVFDIDPSPEIEWKEVIKTAEFIRDELEELNLKSFVKTTGGKGLHVVVPIKRLYTWDEVKIFAHTFVKYLVSLKPDLYIGEMSKAKRKNKIFIDYLRNQRGATSIAPYSTRARDGAPVAVPLAWDELSTKIKSDSFTIENLPKRLKKLKKDPWAAFLKTKQKLPIK